MTRDIDSDDVESFYADLGGLLDSMSTEGSLHSGYYDEEHTDHDAAVENMHRQVAVQADVGPDDRVLDAGCGVGGPAVWLAEHREADVVGINIDDEQLAHCRRRAAEAGVADRTDFRHDDLTEMATVEDGSVDVVFAIEAVTYAEDTGEFFEEARRVLADGGRLAIAEGFISESDLSSEDEALFEEIRSLWRVPEIGTLDGFLDEMAEYGFDEVDVRDGSENVARSTERLARFSKFATPVMRLLKPFGVVNGSQIDVLKAYQYQKKANDRDLTTFAIITARQ